jgi:small-conductance mechanosensitive channel
VAERIATSIRVSAERLFDSMAGALPSIVSAIVVLAIAWGLATVAHRAVSHWARHIDNPTRRNLLRQVSYYAVWAGGVIVALDVLGADVQAMVTGLGLGGVALGFALKDIISNLVSGLLILLMHTFEIDDQIVVGNTEGTVERIEIRATHIRTYDGRLVLVPNGEVFMSRVTNNTASPLRRASVFVYLDYRQDLERALSVILEVVTGVHGVAADPAPSMRLRDLTPDHMQIESRFWTDSRRTDFMNTASAVRVAIVKALKKEGIALPDPDERRVMLVESDRQTLE